MSGEEKNVAVGPICVLRLRCMKAYPIIRRLAILSLTVVGIGSAVGASHAWGMPATSRAVTPFIDLAIWGVLAWKVWARPRKWGLGVGIFVLLLVPFQSWLFDVALANPLFRAQGYNWASFLIFDELPLFIAGVSCISLRFIYPAPTGVDQGTRRAASPDPC